MSLNLSILIFHSSAISNQNSDTSYEEEFLDDDEQEQIRSK